MDAIYKHWEKTVTIGCIVIAAFLEAWQQAATGFSTTIPRLRDGWNYLPLALLTIAGISWMIGGRKAGTKPSPQVAGIVPGIPNLSSLLGQDPIIDFDAKIFFAHAYYSPITAEVEKNIRTIAQQNSPNDKEAFYARFIGVGLIAYVHDTTWFAIFGSQLGALAELNSRGLIPIADIKKHYDQASAKHPEYYSNYSFEQWLKFMKDRLLIATYASQMVELSYHGKDFLKYIAHAGRNNNKAL